MITKNTIIENSDILNNISDVICSFSGKSYFYEIESEFFASISYLIMAHGAAIDLFKLLKNQPDYISRIEADNDSLSFYEKMEREIDPLNRWILKNRNTDIFIDENPFFSINNSVRGILSSKEIDVLLLVGKGMQYKEIAEKFFVYVNIVKRHIDNMYIKIAAVIHTELISKFYSLANKSFISSLTRY